MDDDMANLIVAQLLYLDSADKKRDITMYVNSPGGSVTAGEHTNFFGTAHSLRAPSRTLPCKYRIMKSRTSNIILSLKNS